MKTATLRELRNDFSRLEAWLKEGEQIRIEKRGTPIAMLTGLVAGGANGSPGRPNFAARRRKIWGDRHFSQAEVEAMRADELAGEEG